MDIFTSEKRSDVMSKVKNKDSKLEVRFRKALWAEGCRYRKNSTKYFGKPDLVLKKLKTVIFIDSCFWHCCPEHGEIPRTRREFWKKKLDRNKARDKEVTAHYKEKGWKVVRIWEHDFKKERFERKVKQVINKLKEREKAHK